MIMLLVYNLKWWFRKIIVTEIFKHITMLFVSLSLILLSEHHRFWHLNSDFSRWTWCCQVLSLWLSSQHWLNGSLDLLLPQQHTYATTCRCHSNPPTWCWGSLRTARSYYNNCTPPTPTLFWNCLQSLYRKKKIRSWFFLPLGLLLTEIFTTWISTQFLWTNQIATYRCIWETEPIILHQPISVFPKVKLRL